MSALPNEDNELQSLLEDLDQDTSVDIEPDDGIQEDEGDDDLLGLVSPTTSSSSNNATHEEDEYVPEHHGDEEVSDTDESLENIYNGAVQELRSNYRKDRKDNDIESISTENNQGKYVDEDTLTKSDTYFKITNSVIHCFEGIVDICKADRVHMSSEYSYYDLFTWYVEKIGKRLYKKIY